MQAFNLELKGHWNTNSGKMLAESHLVAPSPDLAQNTARSPPYIPTLWQKAGLPSTDAVKNGMAHSGLINSNSKDIADIPSPTHRMSEKANRPWGHFKGVMGIQAC